ncbi:MAG TPA: tetratricopeptide repeat protein [Longimicrobium sp.]
MLGELHLHPMCFAAWQVFRLVTAWAAQPQHNRFGFLEIEGVRALMIRIAGNDLAPADEPRVALLCVLSEMIAATADLQRLASACMVVTDWALTVSAVETALAYAGAAAEVSGNARFTWVAGMLHRENGRVLQSEGWFQKAHRLAMRSHDWDVRARSLMSSGRMLLTVGKYREAREYFERALLVAERFRLEDRRMEAHHHLFDAAVAMRDFTRVAKHSRIVASAYGPDHPRYPYFSHDLAVYWADRGDYERALGMLSPLLDRHFHEDASVRLLAFGSALRAAAGCGDRRLFDRLLPEFADLREPAGPSPLVAQALYTAGLGASMLRRWSDAEELLVPALEAAEHTGQEDTRSAAEKLLERLP